MNDRPNIPPADELFQTRTAIKALQEREKFLRETMLSGSVGARRELYCR